MRRVVGGITPHVQDDARGEGSALADVAPCLHWHRISTLLEKRPTHVVPRAFRVANPPPRRRARMPGAGTFGYPMALCAPSTYANE